MFDPESRYANIEVATSQITTQAGAREVRYVRRRFIPQPPQGEILMTHTVTQSDRLDIITARYLNDPTQFWRLCDSNNAMRPDELTSMIGRRLRIDPMEF